MQGHGIKHFLVTYDPESRKTKVEEFGTDYDAAQSAYAKAEQDSGIGTKLDIVLLSADSLETIKQTHSSYFNGKDSPGFKNLLAELQLGASAAASSSGAHRSRRRRGRQRHRRAS